ncbi:MAG: MBL fold metallo-hydrolase [Myxococcaceae bacterium]|nr:MBL fold metallo-hydrolase [Myxococcaceae bacterium]
MKAITKSQGLRLERVRASKQYQGGTFRNASGATPDLKGNTFATMGEYFAGGQQRKPPGLLPSTSPLAGWAQAPDSGLRLTWLGHSTVLIELDGARVLTDPVWGERISPVKLVGPKRFQPAPVELEKLPDLDAVVVSHDHYDHLDKPSIQKLAKRDVPFFTSLGVGAHLEKYGVPPERITELDWWETAKVPNTDVVITAAPSQHFSGRGLADRNHTLWSSFIVKGPKHSTFFSGDTGLTEEYREIRERIGPFDAVLLEIGAFHESWGQIHLGPKNALEALKLLGGGLLLPVHWGTFNLALHAWDEPAETMFELAPKCGANVMMPILGAPTEPHRYEGLDPWWRNVKALDEVAGRQPALTRHRHSGR